MQDSRQTHVSAVAAAVALSAIMAIPCIAADVTLTASDGFGGSSFNTAGGWDNAAAPSAGNDYFTSDFILRTPPDANSYTFAGDSLTINNTTAYPTGLFYKGTQSGGIITIADLIFDGGLLSHGNGIGDLCQLDGAITINSASTFYAKQGNIDILADISGPGDLTIPVTDAPGEDNRYVTFYNTNSGYSGSLDVAGRFRLADTGGLTFVIGANGVNNGLSGTGSAVYNGVFTFDLTSAGANPGDAWTIATVANQIYGATFSVAGFTETAPGVWDGPDYWFDTATGVLSYGEPPALSGVFLKSGGDAIGLSSFDNDGSNNWDDGLDPSAGKDYVVTVQFLRSPPNAVDYTFQGDTLTFRSGGALISKHSGNRMLTANWILDGGLIRSGSGDGLVETLAGTLNITSNGGEIRGDQTPYVVTADLSGNGGTLVLGGGSGVAIAGSSTFTGDVAANGTNLEWQSGSTWTFVVGASGVNNQIAGGGSAAFNGTFEVDLTNASTNLGDSWTIADVATQTFGASFSMNGFTETGPGIWINGPYRFNEATGVLSVGAPAGTWDGDTSNLWSVATNWTSDALPNFFGFSSTLTFANFSAVGGTLTNDIVGAELAGIEFSAGEEIFTLDGNPIEIGGPIRNLNSNGQTVAFDVTGTLDFDATLAPITVSGVLSGTNGLNQLGEAPLILTNNGNDFSGPIMFNGLGSIVVAASGALGDPTSEIQLNAYFQGPLATLEFNGGVTQEKVYSAWARAVSDPAHFLSTNGLNTIAGRIDGGSGGDRFIIRAEADSTLVIDADFVQTDFATGTDLVRCDGDGTITFNGDLDDSYTGSTLSVLKTNGDLGTLNLVGPKTHNGDTTCASGTLALVDAGSSNNVSSSGFLGAVSTNGYMDFSGLMGGGIVLTATQTLAGYNAIVGSVQAVSGSTISPGMNGPGVLEFPSLTLDGGANLDIELGDAGSDRIDIGAGGTLVGPSSGVVQISVQLSGGVSAGGYVILDWSAASTVVDVDLADFAVSGGTLSIVGGNQLVLNFDLTSTADVLVTDTGNDRVLKYNVTDLGVWVPDPDQPVFAEGLVGLYDLIAPGALASDSAGNVYVAETDIALEDRVMKLDASGNYLATVAEVASVNPNLDFSGTPAYMVVDPTDSYLFISIAVPNSVAGDTTLEDVIYRVDLNGGAAPVVYIDTTDLNANYVLEDPQGLAFGPDGYLYVGNNLNPTGSPDQGSRVLRFDVSGPTGVFAGVLTTEHREIRSLSYDKLNDRLIVAMNALSDIWAYHDLSLDYVAEGDPSFEYIYNADADEDHPSAVRIGDAVYFSDITSDIIRRVDGVGSAPTALDASAGLIDPMSLLVLWDDPFDFDQDGDVDLADYAVFETLMVGPGVTTPPGGVDPADFARGDVDGDGDVDLMDWKSFTEHFTTN